MKERDYYFDNVKLLLIILVVVGHIIIPLNSGVTFKPLFTLVYAFHMPLFIFVAGYFSKNISKENYGEKIFTNILVPYLIFETLYSLFDFYVIADNPDKLLFTYFYPYWIMWFLASLFCWKIILPFVIKIKPLIVLSLSLIIGILIGYASDVAYYGSISRTIAFFPFFIAGFYFDKKLLERISHWVYKVIAVVIFVIAFVVLFKLQNIVKYEFFYQAIPYADLGLLDWRGGAYRLLSYLLAIVLGLSFLVLVPKRKILMLSNMGRNTLYTFLLHGFVIKYLHSSKLYSYLDGPVNKFFIIVLGVAIAIVLSTNTFRLMFKWIVQPNLNFFFKRKELEHTKGNLSS